MSGRPELESKKHRQLSTGVLAEFGRQMAAMLESGIPLHGAVSILSQKEHNARISGIYRGIYDCLIQGLELSEAMGRSNGVFPPLVISMVKAGEWGGDLTRVMRELAIYYEKNHVMGKRIGSALVYPAFLLAVMAGVFLTLFTVVLPEFFLLFNSMDTLPASTRFLMKASSYLTTHRVSLILGFTAVSVVFIYLAEKEPVRLAMGKCLVHMPVLGELMVFVYTARFARTLSALYAQGVSMVPALRLSIEVVGNSYIKRQLQKVLQDVCVGISLSAGISGVDGLDERLAANIHIGEETGELNELLLSMSEHFELDTEEAAKRFTALIEPALIVVMGVAAGAMMLATVLPLMQYYQGIA